jgi:small subunit ribosomal protein S17
MNNRRRITGVVTSNKMQKTVVVEISRTYRHRLYKKVVHTRKRVMAHDELGCQIGDRVRIVESQPISRHKDWAVEEILRRDIAATVDLAQTESEVEAQS